MVEINRKEQLINSLRVIVITVMCIMVHVITCGYGQIEDQVQETAKAQQNEIHVTVNGNDESGNGTMDSPFATASAAAEASPGSRIIMHGGDYGPLEFGQECSGQEGSPTTITAAEGETVIIHAEDGAGISIVNAHHILIKGLEIVDGTHGIVYTSTRESGEKPLTGIGIISCTVHGVRGVHGICVYARNDLIPVTDLRIEGCEVYDCECGSSESLVINGNIDGFLIAGNSVHDNNNIGIDMIGFEGTAIHPDDDSTLNLYDADYVRNGICRDNIVYNISTEGNPAYYEDGEYDPCAGGIYVDGGQNIEIYNNFIFNCDIGLEVATEHNPEDNELFRVSGIRVHDNVIADCSGWIGLCFGGYDSDRGFTQECEFDHNTLVDNISHIGVQRSRDNYIYANLIIGGETGVEFSEDCIAEEMINNISGNVCAEIDDEESWKAEYGKIYDDRSEIADGFCSFIQDIGSSFIPDEKMMGIYETQMKK